MAQVVIAGRQELVKIQSIRTDTTKPADSQGKTVSISRARRAASRLRSMKSTG